MHVHELLPCFGVSFPLPVRRPTYLNESPYFHEYQQLDHLQKVMLDFKSSRNPRDFSRMMGMMPLDVKELLCFAVWIEGNCPEEPGYGERVLYENPGLICERDFPVISQHGGTLVDQLLHYIHLRKQEKWSALGKDQLETIKHFAPMESLLSFEHLLPELREKVTHGIFEASQEYSKEWGFGERKLYEDARSIFLEKDGYAIVDRLIKECEEQGQTHNYYLAERPLRVFEAVSARCTLRQREALFKALPEGDKSSIGRRLDAPYWGIGIPSTLHHFYGAHISERKTVFRLYAPNAREVRIKIHWEFDPIEVRPLMNIGNGNYETTFYKELENVPYEYELVMHDGRVMTKTDPFARGHCMRPDPKAIVRSPWFHWEDQEWMRDRTNGDGIPRSIYKVLLGSWTGWKGYREQAYELARYCKDMGFTHVELPICEYQTDGSQGYQAFGFFAPTSRFGSLHEFQAFINILHREGIGVFIDVPTHFVPEWWSLDGVGVYESDDTPFGTKRFRWENPFVRNFFISAIAALLESHVDGIRLDFVEQVMHAPYGHLMLQELTQVIHSRFPQALLIAENAVDARDTQRIEDGGLGFDRQVAMGEMDLLVRALQVPFHERNIDEVSHVLTMLKRERGVLAYSHDIFPIFHGDWWKRLAQMRLLFAMMTASNADMLCYMGHELGLEYKSDPPHADLAWGSQEPRLRKLVQDINHLHMRTRALWRCGGAEVIAKDSENKVLGILRTGCDGSKMVVIANFGEKGFEHFFLPMGRVSDRLTEVFNTDAEWFGGTGTFMNRELHLHDGGVSLKLPPLAAAFFSI